MKCTKQSVIGVYPCFSPEIKYTKQSAIRCIFQCSFTGNGMYKTKLPLFASKEKHVGKKHFLFLHKDFDRSKKLSQFTFNGQNFFLLANTLKTFEKINKAWGPQKHGPVAHATSTIWLIRHWYAFYTICFVLCRIPYSSTDKHEMVKCYFISGII
jgi:hypothetical protein